MKAFITKKAIDMFERHNVFSKVELESRYVIWLELYEKVLDIEARTLIEMVKTQVLPDAIEYQNDLANGLDSLTEVAEKTGITDEILSDRRELLSDVSKHIYYVSKNLKIMAEELEKAEGLELEEKTAFFFNELKPHMEHVRKHVDALEEVMPDTIWQLPKYREMLFMA